jgi:hypothetical protein
MREQSFTKNIPAVIIGAMTGLILIVAMDQLVYMRYPMPAGTDMYDAESLGKAVASLPPQAFLMKLLSCYVGAFAAGIAATLLSKRVTPRPPIVTGVILTVVAIYYSMLPQPIWYSVVSITSFIPVTYSTYIILRKRSVKAMV